MANFMKTILHILLLSFGLIINGFSQSQPDLLEKAYKKKSVDMLTQFFDNWTIEIKSNESAYQNDTILEAFKVFKGFYRPTQLSLLGGSEWGDSLYVNSKYFLVQTRLNKIYFVDRLFYSDNEADSLTVLKIIEEYGNDSTKLKLWIHYDKNGRLDDFTIKTFGPSSKYFTENAPVVKDSIMEFYPSIDYTDKKAVYLTKDYQNIIDRFLGSSHTKLGQGGIMNPARSKGASRKRKAFIDNLITTFYGHWGGYWQLNTYPYVYSITFDKEMKYAKVDYRMVYEGGEALLEKQNDKWVIIHAERTWIE
jgi:hypothetical protein